jgi:twitching motility protein PilT
LRQTTNPDDFALRVSGIGGTSDSAWDGFDDAMARPQPGMAAPVAPPRAQPGSPPSPFAQPFAPGSVAASPPGFQRPPAPAAPRPPAPAPAANPNDDFTIERF